jgi:hypothetical protein
LIPRFLGTRTSAAHLGAPELSTSCPLFVVPSRASSLSSALRHWRGAWLRSRTSTLLVTTCIVTQTYTYGRTGSRATGVPHQLCGGLHFDTMNGGMVGAMALSFELLHIMVVSYSLGPFPSATMSCRHPKSKQSLPSSSNDSSDVVLKCLNLVTFLTSWSIYGKYPSSRGVHRDLC